MKIIKKVLIFVVCFSFFGVFSMNAAEGVVGKTYYASPTGSTTATGETAETSLDFRTAILKLTAGDTLKLAAGTYEYSEKIELNASGNALAYINVVNDSEGKAIIDFSEMTFDSTNRGISIKGNYWHFDGIDVTGAGDNGMYISGSYNIIENCEFYENRDSGLQLGRAQSSDTDINVWPHNNLIKSCTSYANYDDVTFGENADGFAAKLTVGYGNVFDSCIAYRNSDDGWDLYAKVDSGNIGTVFLYNCVSFENGYLPDGTVTRDGDGIGFKLGGSTMVGDAVLVNCVAFNNRLHGFSDNSNPGVLSLINCTSFNNSVGTTTTTVDGVSVTKANADFASDKASNNIDLARTANSYNNFFGVLSYMNNAGASQTNKDAFVGSMAHSIVNVGSNKYNQINNYIEASSHEGKIGSSYSGLTDASFKALSLPTDADYTEFHKTLRNNDGSVNLGDMLALADDSPLKTFANESPVGAVLNKTSWSDYPHLEFSVPEAGYTLDERDVLGAYDVLRAICDMNAVYQDIVLPLKVNDCTITWTSSNEDAFKVGTEVTTSLSTFTSVVGSVIRDRSQAVDVKLTATITKGEATKTKEFNLHIMQDEPALGVISNYQSKYLIDQYTDFTEPKIKVSNAASNSGRLLEEGTDKDYVVEKSYEYAKDKNSKYYPVSKIYSNKAGVYRVTYTVKSNIDVKDVKEISFLVYVASPSAQVDFIEGKYEISLTPTGFNVAGNLSNVSGYVYAFASQEATVTAETVKNSGEEYAITDDFIDFVVPADNSQGYYIHVIIMNKDGSYTSEVYTKQVTVAEVSTQQEFYNVVNSAVSSTIIVSLKNDLDFVEFDWKINSHTNQFAGLFNGNNHTISNIKLESTSNNTNMNIFYKLSKGTIMNINFSDMAFVAGGSSKGVGIVGSMIGGYIHNVNISNITLKGNESVGALVGQVTGNVNYISEVSVVNSASNTITSTKRYVGGIVGLFQRDTGLTSCSLTIQNCYVKADLGNETLSIQYLGGILGRGKNDVNGDYLLIDKCIYEGTVASTNNYVGGILGGNDNGLGTVVVSNCVSNVVIIHKRTTYQYTDPILDPETDSYIYTVGHKDASPITGRYTINTGNGSYAFINNYAAFADNNSIVSSIYVNFKTLIKTQGFFTSNVGLDLENIWIWNAETSTISLR